MNESWKTLGYEGNRRRGTSRPGCQLPAGQQAPVEKSRPQGGRRADPLPSRGDGLATIARGEVNVPDVHGGWRRKSNAAPVRSEPAVRTTLRGYLFALRSLAGQYKPLLPGRATPPSVSPPW